MSILCDALAITEEESGLVAKMNSANNISLAAQLGSKNIAPMMTSIVAMVGDLAPAWIRAYRSGIRSRPIPEIRKAMRPKKMKKNPKKAII
jgi:hypothetical protein